MRDIIEAVKKTPFAALAVEKLGEEGAFEVISEAARIWSSADQEKRELLEKNAFLGLMGEKEPLTYFIEDAGYSDRVVTVGFLLVLLGTTIVIAYLLA